MRAFLTRDGDYFVPLGTRVEKARRVQATHQVGLPKRPEIAPDDFCEPLGIQPIAVIPFDAQLFGTASNSGRMIAEMDKKSPTAETFSQLAHIVTGRSTVKKAKKAGLGKMLGLLGRK